MALTCVQGLIHLVFALFIGQPVLVDDPAPAPLATAESTGGHLRHDFVFVRCNVPTLVMTHWTSQRASSLTKLNLPESTWALYEAVGGVLPLARDRSSQRTSAASTAAQQGATKRSAAVSADADDAVAHAWAAVPKGRRTSRQRTVPRGRDGSASELPMDSSRSRGGRTPDSFIEIMRAPAPPVVCEVTTPPAPLPQEPLDQPPPPPLVPRTNDVMPRQSVFADGRGSAEWDGAPMNVSPMAESFSGDRVLSSPAKADGGGKLLWDMAGGACARAADTATAAHARALDPHPEACPERELAAARSSRAAKLWQERAGIAAEQRAQRTAAEARAAVMRVQCAQEALQAADLDTERIAARLHVSKANQAAAAAELKDALAEQARADTARSAAEQQVQCIEEFGVAAASHSLALYMDNPGFGALAAMAGVQACTRNAPGCSACLRIPRVDLRIPAV